jgi:membrane-associated phospholipid phosphatase
MSKNLSFFIPYLFLLFVLGVLQLDFSQTALIRGLHQHYTPMADFCFALITRLGEGWGFGLIFIVFLITKQYQGAIVLAAASLVSSLITQFLKLQIFPEIGRPVTFFYPYYQGFNLPNGTAILLQDHSFPSGHTTSAFTIFCVTTLFVHNKRWGYFFILLAFLVGYSRVYLFQHFVIDTYVGSIIGTSCALAAYGFIPNFKKLTL